MLAGLALYTVASALCSFASDIYQLICFRVLQAVGGGAASAIATAIVKDVYQGKKREKVIALVQAMVVISPAIAPVLGAAAAAVYHLARRLCGAGADRYIGGKRRGCVQRNAGGKKRRYPAQDAGTPRRCAQKSAFAALLIIFSMISIATLAFISSSSYIFQDAFGLSSQVFSYYFTFNAAGMLLGPYIYIRLSARFKRFGIVSAVLRSWRWPASWFCCWGGLRPGFLP